MISGREARILIYHRLRVLSTAPWKAFTVYVALRFASGSGGILVVLQSMLWGKSSSPFISALFVWQSAQRHGCLTSTFPDYLV
jgi:hypothetical protein